MSKIKKEKVTRSMFEQRTSSLQRQLHEIRSHLGMTDITDKPQLKALDQSVFDGLDEEWRFAAVDADGVASYYNGIPDLRNDEFIYLDTPNGAGQSYRLSGTYDASNWQNSLIERESKELTGNELCKAMLKRGDIRIPCLVGDYGEDTKPKDITHIIRKFEDGFFHAKYNKWLHAVPINNIGEPLTASEVGL